MGAWPHRYAAPQPELSPTATHAVINKTLILRMRLLQLLVALLLPVSVACRGVTVLFHPFELGFEILRLTNVR